MCSLESNWLERTTLLIGEENTQKLQKLNVLIVGLGGVGGFAAEFLARAGVGNMTIVDGDKVDITNKNRQIIALDSTVNQPKTNLLYNRLKDINPHINIEIVEEFLTPDRMLELVGKGYDYVLDCIDSVQPKFNLILACKRHDVKFICSMGAGGKMSVADVKVDSIWKTKNDKLARTIRKMLTKKRALRKFSVVYSSEPINEKSLQMTDGLNYKRSFYGTISYMPAIFGLYMAEWVIKKECGIN